LHPGVIATKMQKTIVILTLKQHQNGVWITRLVECLEKSKDVTCVVRSLETWMEDGLVVSSPCMTTNIAAIINRVSDAARPPQYKATLAILGMAQSLGIPVINGPQSYALCGNKWCHHMLFTQAGLKSPLTITFWNDGSSKCSIEYMNKRIKDMKLEKGCTLLVKPNAGGFGAGIKRITLPPQDHDITVFEDSVTLLQKYEQPRDNKLYRVWFLRGKVQCAVERDVQDDNHFTNACSGSCTIQAPPKAWDIPLQVKQELEEQLLPLLPDAHCGSVEFLRSLDSSRMYFDLNLLSTLPIKVTNDGVWQKEYNPWMELAEAILQIIDGRNI
jgi:hypothetical protein